VSAIAAWISIAAMRRISLVLLGTALASACATAIPHPHRAEMDAAANKAKPVHGITQETSNGKEGFVWCAVCPPITPKIASKAGSPHKEATASGMADAGNWRGPATIIYFDLNSAAIKSSEAVKFTGLLKGIGRNTTVRLHGYTDSTGSRPYNQQLAASRVEAVRRWLSEHIKQQVKVRYDIRAYAKCCYAREPGLSPENRRVEIYIREENK